MTLETLMFSGYITSGTEEVVYLTDYIMQGVRILKIIISVENTTIVELSGIVGLNLYNKTVPGSTGNLNGGIRLGGDLLISFSDYLPYLDRSDFQDFMKVQGTPKITFNQSTGANVGWAMQVDVMVD